MSISKKLIIPAAILVVLGAGAAGIWFFFPDWLPEFIKKKPVAQSQQIQKAKISKPEITADLDTFVVNLAGPGLGRYLRATLSLALKSEKEKEELKEFMSPIRHDLIMFLTVQKVDDLLHPEGKSQLRQEIVRHINGVVGKEMVENIYFKEFLIQ